MPRKVSVSGKSIEVSDVQPENILPTSEVRVLLSVTFSRDVQFPNTVL